MGHLYNLTVGPNPRELDEIGLILVFTVFTVPGVLVGGQLDPLVQAGLNPSVVTIVIVVALLAIGGVMLSG